MTKIYIESAAEIRDATRNLVVKLETQVAELKAEVARLRLIEAAAREIAQERAGRLRVSGMRYEVSAARVDALIAALGSDAGTE